MVFQRKASIRLGCMLIKPQVRLFTDALEFMGWELNSLLFSFKEFYLRISLWTQWIFHKWSVNKDLQDEVRTRWFWSLFFWWTRNYGLYRVSYLYCCVFCFPCWQSLQYCIPLCVLLDVSIARHRRLSFSSESTLFIHFVHIMCYCYCKSTDFKLLLEDFLLIKPIIL